MLGLEDLRGLSEVEGAKLELLFLESFGGASVVAVLVVLATLGFLIGARRAVLGAAGAPD